MHRRRLGAPSSRCQNHSRCGTFLMLHAKGNLSQIRGCHVDSGQKTRTWDLAALPCAPHLGTKRSTRIEDKTPRLHIAPGLCEHRLHDPGSHSASCNCRLRRRLGCRRTLGAHDDLRHPVAREIRERAPAPARVLRQPLSDGSPVRPILSPQTFFDIALRAPPKMQTTALPMP